MRQDLLMRYLVGMFGSFFFLLLPSPDSAIHGKLNENIKKDTLIDSRDGQEYEILQVDSIWWFNQNLNYQTLQSDCYKDDEANCQILGQLYYYEEAKNACPDGWRLPSNKEFDALLYNLSLEKNFGIIYLENSWDNLNEKNLVGFNFQQSGMKDKKRYPSTASLNLWLDNDDVGYHVHIYKERKKLKRTKLRRMVLFRHNHEERFPILKKRKLSVRCVCETKSIH